MKKTILFTIMGLFLIGIVTAYQPVDFSDIAGNIIPYNYIMDDLGSNDFNYGGLCFWLPNATSIILSNYQYVIDGDGLIWYHGVQHPYSNIQSWEKDLTGYDSVETLYMISHMGADPTITQGTNIARMDVTDTEDNVHTFNIQAGIHTADWTLGCPISQVSYGHSAGEVVYSVNDGCTVFYLGVFEFDEPIVPKKIRFEYTAGTGQLYIKGITFDEIEQPIPEFSAVTMLVVISILGLFIHKRKR